MNITKSPSNLFLFLAVFLAACSMTWAEGETPSEYTGSGSLRGTNYGSGTNGYADLLKVLVEYTIDISDFKVTEAQYDDDGMILLSAPIKGAGKAKVTITGYSYDFHSGPRNGETLTQSDKLDRTSFDCAIQITIDKDAAKITFPDKPTVNRQWHCVDLNPEAGGMNWSNVNPYPLGKFLFGSDTLIASMAFNDVEKYFDIEGEDSSVEQYFCKLTFKARSNGYLDFFRPWDESTEAEMAHFLNRTGLDGLEYIDIGKMVKMSLAELIAYLKKAGLAISGIGEKAMKMTPEEAKKYLNNMACELKLGKELAEKTKDMTVAQQTAYFQKYLKVQEEAINLANKKL